MGSISKVPVGSLGDGPESSSSSMNFYQHDSIASHACAGIAIAEMSIRLSVCPSVCPSHSDIISKRTNIHGFFTDGEREDSSFCRYPVRPEIRKGSLRARAIYETGVVRTGSASNGLACSGFRAKLLGSLQS